MSGVSGCEREVVIVNQVKLTSNVAGIVEGGYLNCKGEKTWN